MSTARHIRHARRVTGWPLGHADPEEEDEFEPVECGDAFDIEPEYVDDDAYLASAAEDRWIAGRDAGASQ